MARPKPAKRLLPGMRARRHRGALVTALAVLAFCTVLFASFERAWLSAKPRVLVRLATPQPLLDARQVQGRVEGLERFSVRFIRENVRALDWVEDAAVRLRWPHSIEVLIRPKQLVARLDENRLLLDDGTAIPLGRGRGAEPTAAALPRVSSRERGLSNGVLVQRLGQVKAALQAGGHLLDRLEISDFGGWTLHTKGGLRVELGSEQLEDRLGALAVHMRGGALEALATPVLDLRHGGGAVTALPQGGGSR